MKRSRWMNVLALALAVLVLLAGMGLVNGAGDWLFPAEGPVYVSNESMGATVLRFEGDDELLLYPMDEYDPDACIPAVESEVFTKGADSYFSAMDNIEATYADSMEDSKYIAMYRDYLDDGFVEAYFPFFMAQYPSENPDGYLERFSPFQNTHLVDAVVYQPENGVFYLLDLPVMLPIYGCRYGDVAGGLNGKLTVAFRSNLWDKFEILYLRFDTDARSIEGDTVEGDARWLQECYEVYWNNKEQVEWNNPFPSVADYLRGEYLHQRKWNSSAWNQVFGNLECAIYGEDILCIFSDDRQRVVAVFSSALDTFVGYSIYAAE